MSTLLEEAPIAASVAPRSIDQPHIEMSPDAGADACSLDNYLVLPDHTMDDRIAAARARLGTSTILLGHHYQRDEVIRFADVTGDSYKLSKIAAETESRYIVFCGVHFMAESADVLGRGNQQVILPDLNAGCSMADMAEIGQVEDCWDSLMAAGLNGSILPLTYMNSAASIKAFCGERGGLVCTSSNARAAFEWAFARGRRFCFCLINISAATLPLRWAFPSVRWPFGTPTRSTVV
jgi:quinolinate synthase